MGSVHQNMYHDNGVTFRRREKSRPTESNMKERQIAAVHQDNMC